MKEGKYETSGIEKYINSTKVYDIPFNFKTPTSNGWKLSLQGKTVNDSIILYKLLSNYLSTNKISFKVGTRKRIEHTHPEQSKKIMTIYCPNDMDVKHLAQAVYERTMGYKGWYDIKTPTSYEHFAGCVFIRNDRDKDGNYLKPNFKS